MRIAKLLARGRPTISFEFMAPRDEAEVDVLERTVSALAGHAPDWVSVTYRLRTGRQT
ncbi:MAG: 5,10-methylenetetrahydrofolate reductase, partial [Chloroflexi bacterium]